VVNPLLPVSVSIAVSGNNICQGTSITATASIINGGNSPAIQWYRNNVQVTGQTGLTYTLVPDNGDVIRCEVTSNALCSIGNPAISNDITCIVNPLLPVSVTLSATNTTVCAGTAVTVTATPVNGGTSPLYQWFKNGNVVTGISGSVYTFTPVNGDVVYCKLTSNASCITGSPASSQVISFTVNPLLPVSVSITASSTSVLLGTSVTFTATPVNGGSNPVYQWKVNGNNVGANSATYTYTPANADVIKCVLTSNATCISNNPATSNTIVMEVISVPANLVLQNLTISDTRCYNATQTITVSGTGKTFVVTSTGKVTMIAGQKIRLLVGTKVSKYGYYHGYISTQYCNTIPPAAGVIATGEQEIPADENTLGMKFYPNPTTGDFTLELTGDLPEGNTRAMIYDMQGKCVLNTDLTGLRSRLINIGDKPAGLYIIRVINDHRIFTGRIVKR
jgi:hypothetical protein